MERHAARHRVLSPAGKRVAAVPHHGVRRRCSALAIVPGLIVSLLHGVMSPKPAFAAAAVTTRVSVSSTGGQGNAASGGYYYGTAISADGRYVAFRSDATDLVPGVTTDGQIYRHDSLTGVTVLVSTNAAGDPGDSQSYSFVTMSADGRYVAFSTYATNLVADDTNAREDAFVKDMTTGGVERVSVDSAGAQANNHSDTATLSRNGRYVTFQSLATNLVPGDANARADVFLHDLTAGTTTLVSVATSGAQGDRSSGVYRQPVSDDGRYVAFDSSATNLSSTQTNTYYKVFLRDLQEGTTTQVSVSSTGAPPTSAGDSNWPDMSADGRYVTFLSQGDGLVPEDSDYRRDIFVRDTVAGTTSRVSVDANGATAIGSNYYAQAPTITADGRYVGFASSAENWAPDTGEGYHLFVKDTATGGLALASVATDGTPAHGPSGSISLSADARAVAFFSHASDLVAGDTNGVADVFRRAMPADWITRSAAELYGVRRAGGYAEDPVNTATGNFTDAVFDLDYPESVFGLDLGRTYNSLDTTSGPLGPGWAHSFSSALSHDVATGDVVLGDWDGRLVTFAADEAGGFVRPEEVFGDLNRRLDGSWFIAYDDGRVEEFDAGGRLVERRNWDGQSVTLGYAGSRLATVTDAGGGVTTYESNVSGRITRVVDPDAKLVVANTFDDRGRVATQETPSGDTVTFSYDDPTGRTTVSRQASGASTIYVHDPAGRLIAVTDAHGAVLTKSYDAAGNLVAVTDRRGGALSQTFDGRGNLLSRSGPEGVTETFTYDASGRLTSATDGEADTTTFTYEGDERLPTSVVDPAGGTTTYAVGPDGLITSATDADGVSVAFGYDARRNLTTTTDAAAKVTTLGYDAAGNQTSQTTPLGLVATWTWDGQRRPLATTDPSGSTVSQSWTPGGRLATTTDAEDNVTRYDYDGAGRLRTTTDALGHATTYGYDADGNLTAITRPPAGVGLSAPVWQATYDALGRRTSETDPTGVTTTYGHDADGNRTTTTDENGGTVARTFDLLGRLSTQTDPLGHQTTYTWDKADRLASVTDPLGAATSLGYDGAGRLVTVTDAANAVWAKGYTPAGRPAGETDPLGRATAHAYDARGRLASTTDPGGAVTAFGYDDDGRLVSQASPEGLVTTYAYDHAQRKVTVTSPAGGATVRTHTPRGQLAILDPPATAPSSFAYDAVGRLERATDALGHPTTFTYDARGNRVSRTDAKGAVETYTYDAADRPTGRLDALGRLTTVAYDNLGRLSTVSDPSGRSATIGYDAASRVVSRTWAAGAFGGAVAVTYGYDAAGRRTSMTGPDGTTTWAYNALGRLSSTNAGGKALAYGYDAAGQRTSLTYPDATTATSTYDAAGHLATLSHPSAGTIAYAWDDDGRLLAEDLPGPDGRSWSYDAAGRLATYAETVAGESRTTTLARDLADRMTSEVTGGTPATYGYDSAGQLTTVTRGTGLGAKTTTYAYDAVGNRTSKATPGATVAYAYDPASQLTAATRTGLLPQAVAFTHDGAGRLSGATSSVAGLVSSRSLSYDAKGHLAEVRSVRPGLLGGSLVDTTTRTTDADGRLLGLSTTDSEGHTSQRTLTWDLARSVPQIATSFEGATGTSFLSGAAGMAIGVRSGQGDAFAADVHGSTLATGEAADLAQADSYDEFGSPVTSVTDLLDELLGALAGSADDPAKFAYRGELSADGLLHLRAREYAPSLGRFTTIDPLDGVEGEVTVANPYHYANNDPLNQMDPFGLRPVNDSDMRLISTTRRGVLGWTGFKQTLGGIFDSGKGVVTGTSHLVTNPTQLWRVPENAYRDFGGGWEGSLAAINQFNPLYHGLNNAQACIDANSVDDAYGVGYGCTALIFDAAGAAALAAGGAAGATSGVNAIKGRAVFDERGSIGGSDGPGPNLGNLKRMSDSRIEETLGVTAHELKIDVLGRKAPISRYDIYSEGKTIYLVEKSTGKVVETGWILP